MYKPLACWVKTFGRRHLQLFFLFFPQKISVDSSSKLSSFYEENKKNVISLSYALFDCTWVKVKTASVLSSIKD